MVFMVRFPETAGRDALPCAAGTGGPGRRFHCAGSCGRLSLGVNRGTTMRRWIGGAAAIVAMGLASAAAAFDRPQVTDARPRDEREAKVLSGFLLSCNYGIVRIGDAGREPDRIERLRRDLTQAPDLGLDGKPVTVKRYSVLSVETVLLDLRVGSCCARENTKAGLYCPEEAVTNTAQPIVIETALSIDGQTYEARR